MPSPRAAIIMKFVGALATAASAPTISPATKPIVIPGIFSHLKARTFSSGPLDDRPEAEVAVGQSEEVEERREEQDYVDDYVRAYLLRKKQIIGPQQQQAVSAHREGRQHREDVEDGCGSVLLACDEEHRDPEQNQEPQEREVELAHPEAPS